MTGPYGYPAQQPQQPQQPGPGYGGPGYGYGPPQQQAPRPSGATAIIAAVLGLGLTGLIGYVPIHTFIVIPSGYSLGDLPSGVLTMLVLYLATALLLLIGALATFFRSFAGGILLLVGALLTVGAILIEPLLILRGQYSTYFKYLFGFENFGSIAGASALVLAPLLFLLAVIPPTFKYLRYQRPAPQAYGRQPQAYPPQRW